MSKNSNIVYSKSQQNETNSNFVELEPELFLSSRKLYEIKHINYKKNNNNQDIIVTPKAKYNKNNLLKSKIINNKGFKIPFSSKNITNIKLNFNDNKENNENNNKNNSNYKQNLNNQNKIDKNKKINKNGFDEKKLNKNEYNEKILNINDFNYKSNNKIIKLEKTNSNKNNKNIINKEKKSLIFKKEKSYYSFSEISSLDLNKTSSDINNNINNSIEY